jgi:hypothetical protein
MQQPYSVQRRSTNFRFVAWQRYVIRVFHDLGGGAPTQVVKEIFDEHLNSLCCR